MRFLLDTNTASHFIQSTAGIRARAEAELQEGHRIGISIPVLAELAFGIENSTRRVQNMELLGKAMQFLRLWPLDEVAAYTYGQIQTVLRSGQANRSYGCADCSYRQIDGALHIGDVRSGFLFNP